MKTRAVDSSSSREDGRRSNGSSTRWNERRPASPGPLRGRGSFGLLRNGELQDERLAEGLEEVRHLPAVGRGDPHVGEVRAHGQDRGVEAEGGQTGGAWRYRA